jgi:hypothetical protein
LFDLVVLRRNSLGEQVIDVGLLAETLLFYQKVHLLLDAGTLTYLVKVLGGDLLIELFDRGGITASYLRDTLGTVTHTNNGMTTHNFAEFRFDPGKQKRLNDREWIELQLERTLGRTRKTRSIAKHIIKKIAFSNYKSEELGEDGLVGVARADLKNPALIQKAMLLTLKNLVPTFEAAPNWHFQPLLLGDHFAIDTNFDFQALNEEYHKRVPATHSSLDPAYLITQFLDARGSLLLGAKFMSELVIDPTTAGIARLMCVELMRKRDRQIKEVDLFQELTLDGRKLREAINKGERTFQDFLKLLDRAAKFKEWVSVQNPEHTLVKAYFAEVTRESWIDRLPVKGAHFIIATALGKVAEQIFLGADLGLGALDALLVDRLLKGWRPNQFIESNLYPFVEGA